MDAGFAAGRPWQRGMRMPDVPSGAPVRGGAPVYGSTAMTSISSLALGGMRPATTVVVASGRKYRSNTSWTPSMALGVADHIWTIGELVEAATNPETVPPRHAPFTVIDGGMA